MLNDCERRDLIGLHIRVIFILSDNNYFHDLRRTSVLNVRIAILYSNRPGTRSQCSAFI